MKTIPFTGSNKSFFILLYCMLFIFFITLSIETAEDKNQLEELYFENSHFMKVEGVQMHYRVWKPTENLPLGNILLLHGLGGSIFSWRFVAPDLAKQGYLVLAVDLPGFGLSQRKPPVMQSHEMRGNLVWKLIEKIDIPGSWHLVGHSMGGGTAIVMVLQKPINSLSLTLVDGSIDYSTKRIWSLLSRSRLMRKLAGKIINRFFLTRKRIKLFLSSAYGREPTSEEVEGYYQPLKVKETIFTLTNLLKRYKSDQNLKKRINEIGIPVLCLWGRKDEWISLDKGIELIQEILDSRLVIIDEAKHCPMETHPVLFNQYLIQFFQNND